MTINNDMKMTEDYWFPYTPDRKIYKIDVSNCTHKEAKTIIEVFKNKLKGTKEEETYITELKKKLKGTKDENQF